MWRKKKIKKKMCPRRDLSLELSADSIETRKIKNCLRFYFQLMPIKEIKHSMVRLREPSKKLNKGVVNTRRKDQRTTH